MRRNGDFSVTDSCRHASIDHAPKNNRGVGAAETDGLSRLIVGGATLSRIARIEKIASMAPAAPRRWPVEDLVDDIDTLEAALPSSRSTAPSSISSPTWVEVPWALM